MLQSFAHAREHLGARRVIVHADDLIVCNGAAVCDDQLLDMGRRRAVEQQLDRIEIGSELFVIDAAPGE